jgi:hypothetical protein
MHCFFFRHLKGTALAACVLGSVLGIASNVLESMLFCMIVGTADISNDEEFQAEQRVNCIGSLNVRIYNMIV